MLSSAKKRNWVPFILLLIPLFFLTGCFATATVHGPPPMEKRQGTAPTAAMLPFENTNDQNVADFTTEKIKNCLDERNVLDFVDQGRVRRAVSASGYDMGTMFGLKSAQYKNLANKLGVDYTIHGTITVKKNITFSGWRKDVDVYLNLYDSSGEKVDSWRSMTGFAFTKGETAVNAEEMAASAANHTCSKMLERQY